MKPNKLLGQHFLTSEAIARRIAEAAQLTADTTVLEVGPGHGILTRMLAQRSKEVIAVEKDDRLASLLETALRGENVSNVRIIHGDILRTPLDAIGLPHSYCVVANIPYYLTSRLIRTLLTLEAKPSEILLMIQKEVAERITAKPPSMSLLALSVQAYGSPRILFSVKKDFFSPRPQVDSSVIRIDSISSNLFAKYGVREEDFFRICRAAFQLKRKTLINSLSHNLGKEKALLEETIRRVGIHPTARPEMLGVPTWLALTHAFDQITH